MPRGPSWATGAACSRLIWFLSLSGFPMRREHFPCLGHFQKLAFLLLIPCPASKRQTLSRMSPVLDRLLHEFRSPRRTRLHYSTMPGTNRLVPPFDPLGFALHSLCWLPPGTRELPDPKASLRHAFVVLRDTDQSGSHFRILRFGCDCSNLSRALSIAPRRSCVVI